MSIMTDPFFIEETISAVNNVGAGLPGIKAVQITMS
jgi:hypothetical protein